MVINSDKRVSGLRRRRRGGRAGVGAAAAAVALLWASSLAAAATPNLISNGRFQERSGGGAAGWTPWSPDWKPNAVRVRATSEGLVMDAPGRPYAVGGARQSAGAVAGGQAYEVAASCRLRDIRDPLRSVMVRLAWTRQGRRLHPAGWLVRGPVVEGGEARFRDVLVAPPEADGAELSLELKWPRGGSVTWRSVALRAAEPPPPRRVKIGTVHMRPRNSTPERNLELFCGKIDQAGQLGLDIVCLPELITKVGTSLTTGEVAEPIPGPATERLGQAARRNRVWVVAGLAERVGQTIYNTAVLINRRGELTGKYRKVHLPREEWTAGVTPGHDYPVFDTDFGKVAVLICYDWFFPEPHAILALRGAEIVFSPTWGNTLPDDETGAARGETVYRTRARDNGFYLVPSVYSGRSMIIDPMGRILAASQTEGELVWAEADLNRRERLPWVGYWRAVGVRDRMPGSYDLLMQ